jgi:uncharacterized alkaline shock family protein YloU
VDAQKPEINTEMGTIRIADEVVSTVAGIAAAEVEGVASLSGGWGTDLVEKLGRKNLGKGIKVEVLDGSTSLITQDLYFNMPGFLNIFFNVKIFIAESGPVLQSGCDESLF